MTPSPRFTDTLDQFLAEDDSLPVVMLNLLRFVPGGEATYRSYLERAEPIIERLGGHVVFGGGLTSPVIVEDSVPWDAVVLVAWDRRSRLRELVADDEYQTLNRLRLAALDGTVLHGMASWRDETGAFTSGSSAL